MSTNGFSMDVHGGPGALWLTVVGELDIGGIDAMEYLCRSAFPRHGQPLVVINVAGLTFCDLLGWRALLRCHAAGVSLRGTPSCLQRLLELVGETDRLPADARDPWPAEPSVAKSGEARGLAGARPRIGRRQTELRSILRPARHG